MTSNRGEIADLNSQVEDLLRRPVDQRRREYKYRFAQSVVFGVPVLALQIWGPALGPADAQRWTPILQALLAGWILYLNAGMLIESLLALPRRLLPELFISVSALAVFLYSLLSVLNISSPHFHIAVLILIAWDGLRWFMLSRQPTDG